MNKIISGRKVLSHLSRLQDALLAEQFLKAVMANSTIKAEQEVNADGSRSHIYDLDTMACAAELSELGFAAKSPETLQLMFSTYFEPDNVNFSPSQP